MVYYLYCRHENQFLSLRRSKWCFKTHAQAFFLTTLGHAFDWLLSMMRSLLENKRHGSTAEWGDRIDRCLSSGNVFSCWTWRSCESSVIDKTSLRKRCTSFALSSQLYSLGLFLHSPISKEPRSTCVNCLSRAIFLSSSSLNRPRPVTDSIETDKVITWRSSSPPPPPLAGQKNSTFDRRSALIVDWWETLASSWHHKVGLRKSVGEGHSRLVTS